MQKICAIILLSALVSNYEALPQTKWSRPIRNSQGSLTRERRQFPFGEWIPLSQPCPTCRPFADPLDAGLRGENIGLTPPRPPTVTRQIHGEGNFFPQDESSILSVPPPPPSAIPRHPNGNFQFSSFGQQFSNPLPTQKVFPQTQQVQFLPQTFLTNQPLLVNGNQQILSGLNGQGTLFAQEQQQQISNGKVAGFGSEFKTQKIPENVVLEQNNRQVAGKQTFSNKPQPFSPPPQNQQQTFVQQQAFGGQQQVFNGQQQGFGSQQQTFGGQQQHSVNFGSSILTPPPAPKNISQDVVIPGLDKEEIQLLYVPVETLRQKGTAQEQLLTQQPQNIQFFNRGNGLKRPVSNIRPTEQTITQQKGHFVTQNGNGQGQSDSALKVTSSQPFPTTVTPSSLLLQNLPFQQTPQPFVSATPATPTIQPFVTPSTSGFQKFSSFAPETTLSHLSTVPNTIQFGQSDIEFGTTPKAFTSQGGFKEEIINGKSQFSGLKNAGLSQEQGKLFPQPFVNQQQTVTQQPLTTVFSQEQQNSNSPTPTHFPHQIDQQQIALQKQQEQQRLLQQQRQAEIEEQRILEQQRKQKEQRLLQEQQVQKELEQQRFIQKQKELEEQRLLEQQRQKELEEQRLIQKQKEQEEQRLLQQQRQKELEEQRLLQQQRQKELEEQRYLQQQRQKELEEQRLLQQRQKELEQQRFIQKQKELEEQRLLQQQRYLQEQRQKELENQRRLQIQKQKELEEKRRIQQKQKEEEQRLLRFQQQQKELEQQRLLQQQQEEQQRAIQQEQLQKQKQENLKKQQQFQLFKQQQQQQQQTFPQQNFQQTNRHVLPANDKLNFIPQQESDDQQLVPHQPPLSVFFKGSNAAESRITDVLRELRSSNTITVLDQYFEKMPKVFVGPAGLIPPSGYEKFDLPYLSNLETNRIERKIGQLPFFVAPLNFVPPPGYAKIPFPAPHVGSVVVSSESNPAMTTEKGTASDENVSGGFPVVGPELPGLINNLHTETTTVKPVTYVSTPSLPQTTAQLRNRRPNTNLYKPQTRKPITRTRPTTTSKPEEEVTQPIQKAEVTEAGVRKPFNRFLNRRRQQTKTTTETPLKSSQDGKNLENRHYSVEVYHQEKNQVPRTQQKNDVINGKQTEGERFNQQFDHTSSIDRITPGGHGVFDVRPTPDFSQVSGAVSSEERRPDISDYSDVNLQSFEDGPLPTGSAKTITQELYRPNAVPEGELTSKLSKPESSSGSVQYQSSVYDSVTPTKISEPTPTVEYESYKGTVSPGQVRVEPTSAVEYEKPLSSSERYDSTEQPAQVTASEEQYTKGFLGSNEQYTSAFAEISKPHHIPGFVDSTQRQHSKFSNVYPTTEVSLDLQAPQQEQQEYQQQNEYQQEQKQRNEFQSQQQPTDYQQQQKLQKEYQQQEQQNEYEQQQKQQKEYQQQEQQNEYEQQRKPQKEYQQQGQLNEYELQQKQQNEYEQQQQRNEYQQQQRQQNEYRQQQQHNEYQQPQRQRNEYQQQKQTHQQEQRQEFDLSGQVQPTQISGVSINKFSSTGSPNEQYSTGFEASGKNQQSFHVSTSQVSPTAPGATEEQYTTGFSVNSQSQTSAETNRQSDDQRIGSFISVQDVHSTAGSPVSPQQYFPSSTVFPSQRPVVGGIRTNEYGISVEQNQPHPSSSPQPVAEVAVNPSVQTYTSAPAPEDSLQVNDQTQTNEGHGQDLANNLPNDHRLKFPNPSIVRVRTRVRGKSRGQVNFAASHSTTPASFTRSAAENKHNENTEQELTTKTNYRDFHPVKTNKYNQYRGVKKPLRTTTEAPTTEHEQRSNIYTIRPPRRPLNPSTVSTKRIRRPTTPLPSAESATEAFGISTVGPYSQSEHSDISPSGVSNDVYYEQSSLSPVKHKFRKHFGSAEQKNDVVPAYISTAFPSASPTFSTFVHEDYSEEGKILSQTEAPLENPERYPEWNPSESGFDVSGIVLTTIRTPGHDDQLEVEEPKKSQDGKKAFDPDLEKKTGRRRVRVRVHKRPHENFETAESQNLRTVANVLVPPTTTYKPNDESSFHQLAKNADFSFGGQKLFGARSREYFRKRLNLTQTEGEEVRAEGQGGAVEAIEKTTEGKTFVRKGEKSEKTDFESVSGSSSESNEGKPVRPKFRGYVRKIVKHGKVAKEADSETNQLEHEENEGKQGNTEYNLRQSFRGGLNHTGRVNGTRHKTFVRYVKKNKIRHETEPVQESDNQESQKTDEQEFHQTTELHTSAPGTETSSTVSQATEEIKEEKNLENESPVFVKQETDHKVQQFRQGIHRQIQQSHRGIQHQVQQQSQEETQGEVQQQSQQDSDHQVEQQSQQEIQHQVQQQSEQEIHSEIQQNSQQETQKEVQQETEQETQQETENSQQQTEKAEEIEVKQTQQPVIQTTEATELPESSSQVSQETPSTPQPSTALTGLYLTQRPKFYQTLRPVFQRPTPTSFQRTREPEPTTERTTTTEQHSETQEKRTGFTRYKYGKTTGYGQNGNTEKSDEIQKITEQQTKNKNLHTLEVRKYLRTKNREGAFSQFSKNKYFTSKKTETVGTTTEQESVEHESEEITTEHAKPSSAEPKTTEQFIARTDSTETETTENNESELPATTTEAITSSSEEESSEEEEEEDEATSTITTTESEIPTTVFRATEKVTEPKIQTTETVEPQRTEYEPDIYRFSKNSFNFEAEKFIGTKNRAHVRNITTDIIENTASFSAPGVEKRPEIVRVVTHRSDEQNPTEIAQKTEVGTTESSRPETTESNKSETTTEYPETAETETASSSDAVTKSKVAKVLKTSTTTKISHETEICYRGKCIRTKSENPDDDLKLLVDSASTMKIEKTKT